MTLATAAANHRGTGRCADLIQSTGNPALVELAIAIHDLDELGVRIDLPQFGDSRISRSSSGEWDRSIEFDDVNTHRPREFDAGIGRAGIDIHGRASLLCRRSQAAPQSLTFVATDGDNADRIDRLRSHGAAA